MLSSQRRTSASPDAVLVLDGVSASYGARPVIHDLSLSLARGDVVAMLGHNGAGKTTAMRIATGLKQPSHGRVTLLGRDASGMSTAQRAVAGMALVPEGVRGLFPTLTVRQNLEAIERPRRDGDPGWASVDAAPARRVSRGPRRPPRPGRGLDERRPEADAGHLARAAPPADHLASRRAVDRPRSDPRRCDLRCRRRGRRSHGDNCPRRRARCRARAEDRDARPRVATGEVVAEFDREDYPPPTELWRYF